MLYYQDFERTNQSFAERSGDPDEFTSAIGRIALWHSELDDQLTSAISALMMSNASIAQIVTAELSFRQKLDVLASLVRLHLISFNFNYEQFTELFILCQKANELRNRVMHSSWSGTYLSDALARRKKISAKARTGLNVIQEDMDSGYLLDIADFIIYVAMEVRDFFCEHTADVA